MPRIESPKQSCAKLVWDANNQPQSQQFDDIYFSRVSGLEESRYVFLQQNQLWSRWENMENNSHFLIVETGFGTGLNFLATWQLWNEFTRQSKSNVHLHFYSVEKFPLTRTDLEQALSLWPELAKLADQLLCAYPLSDISGIHKLAFGNITLNLFIGDVVAGLKLLLPDDIAGPKVKQLQLSAGIKRPLADAWYLDGFAPAKNPEMWRPELFQYMSRLSKTGTSFSTFTSAGEVKRGLQTAGFACKKIKGFGTKREMLIGEFVSSMESNSIDYRSLNPSTANSYVSWHLVENTYPDKSYQSAIIVGSGLAACHLAHALATRGLSVRILEKENHLASGASGNRRGILYTRLSPHQDSLSRFNLSALLYACRFYENNNLFALAGKQCGVLHLATNEKESEYYRALALRFSEHKDFLRWLPATEGSSISGVQLHNDGIFLAKAGWLDPRGVCQHLCSHPNIEVFTETKIDTFFYDNAQWYVNNNLSADLIFLANAHDANQFAQTAHLPLKKIRGQVSYIESSPPLDMTNFPELSTAICGDGYVAPLGKRGLCIGASFNLKNMSPELDPEDHVENLQRLQAITSDYGDLQTTVNSINIPGQVGFRCTTPDYFPLAGPLPHAEAFRDRFHQLSKKARANIDACGIYYPGLFCLTGLGSRGLAYAPLVADALASTVSGEPPPIDLQTWLHCHPARFLIRNLIRNQPIPGLNLS